MEIISVSRRTDIPAFYAEWFRGRFRAGCVRWRNPYGGKPQEVSLRPEDVRGYVFWSRNYGPFLSVLDEISRTGVPFYCHYTLTGLPGALEPRVPPWTRGVEVARTLADTFGPDRLVWRYDPIVLSSATQADFHRRRFGEMARHLAGATRRCIMSFTVFYRKVLRNAEDLRAEKGIRLLDPNVDERRALAAELSEMAHAEGIALEACCSDDLLSTAGGGKIGKARCVDAARLLALGGRAEEVRESVPSRPTREECGCSASRDIGAYDTCPHGCVYCYANSSPALALTHFRTLRAGNPQRVELVPREDQGAQRAAGHSS